MTEIPEIQRRQNKLYQEANHNRHVLSVLWTQKPEPTDTIKELQDKQAEVYQALGSNRRLLSELWKQKYE